MRIAGKNYKTIWFNEKNNLVQIIDQTKLPHSFEIITLSNIDDAVKAIKDMKVRGAPLIGGAAAYGIYLAMKENPSDEYLKISSDKLIDSRPTAVNLKSAIDIMNRELQNINKKDRHEVSLKLAQKFCAEDEAYCKNIGTFGKDIIERILVEKNLDTINILTHCNAGWLATIDWGTATSPIYHAIKEGIKIHVWVDETRPRNQGASLTSYELSNEGVPNTIISDNTGGYLMQKGQVDLCITGADRVLNNGDVINKIGTYLKALAARDNDIPFYVAIPGTTIDQDNNKITNTMIEHRSSSELTHMKGLDDKGRIQKIRIYPEECKTLNPAFDMTPGEYVTGLITECGIFESSEIGLREYYSAAEANR
tara:strand:+ start:2008 stop:3105 length:1098 start_codon:yes stop_codon:yes gene_type:complete